MGKKKLTNRLKNKFEDLNERKKKLTNRLKNKFEDLNERKKCLFGILISFSFLLLLSFPLWKFYNDSRGFFLCFVLGGIIIGSIIIGSIFSVLINNNFKVNELIYFPLTTMVLFIGLVSGMYLGGVFLS